MNFWATQFVVPTYLLDLYKQKVYSKRYEQEVQNIL